MCASGMRTTSIMKKAFSPPPTPSSSSASCASPRNWAAKWQRLPKREKYWASHCKWGPLSGTIEVDRENHMIGRRIHKMAFASFKEVLLDGYKNGYAVGQFNINNLEF